jgi:dipeptidyl-peptidase-3
LPNAEWIRAQYGSKSVTIENITKAYDEAGK